MNYKLKPVTLTLACSILNVSGRVVSLRQPLSGSRPPRLQRTGEGLQPYDSPDPRVMALLGALCVSLTVLGFTHRSLRAQVNHLLDADYSTNQMSYDLARLRTNGLIQRREHSNSYNLTADGLRVALFYVKVHNRLLRPLLAADQPPAPLELRRALATIDHHARSFIETARLSIAA